MDICLHKSLTLFLYTFWNYSRDSISPPKLFVNALDLQALFWRDAIISTPQRQKQRNALHTPWEDAGFVCFLLLIPSHLRPGEYWRCLLSLLAVCQGQGAASADGLLAGSLKQHRESLYRARSKCVPASSCLVLLRNLIYSRGLTLRTLFHPNNLPKIWSFQKYISHFY